MDTFFGPDFFTNNRAKLRAQIGSDIPIIIAGNGQIQKSADEPYKFVQDSSFWYLTGLNGADLTLVIGHSDTYLLVPTLSFVREAFDGAHDLAAYAARSGITTIMTAKDGWQRLRHELASESTAATLAAMPTYLQHHGIYTLPYRRRLIEKLKRLNPKLSIRDIRMELAALRSIKQPEELLALQKAIDITDETLQEIVSQKILHNATHEYQLEAALTYGFRMKGGEGHGFAPIVGAGAHSTTLHHMENNGLIDTNDLIVLDVGAEVEHYSADISRTISRQPITGRAAEVWNAVATVQDYAIGLIKPGILPSDYEKAVEKFMGDQLRRLGIITGNTREEIRRYFPHATSHFLGLDTHDAGDYRQPFQENMVITCEPGIYLPEERIGVRIEDDIVITKDGNKLLSAACPRMLTPVQ